MLCCTVLDLPITAQRSASCATCDTYSHAPDSHHLNANIHSFILESVLGRGRPIRLLTIKSSSTCKLYRQKFGAILWDVLMNPEQAYVTPPPSLPLHRGLNQS